MVCKTHFEEVQSKYLSEEENSEESWKYAPNIWEGIYNFEVPPVGHRSDGGPFDPEVGGGGSGVEDGLPLFESLAGEAGLGGKVGKGQQAWVGSYFVFVEFVDVLVPDSVAELQDIFIEVVKEGILAVGVGDGVKVIYKNTSTVIDSTGLGAVEAEENALPCVAKFEGPSNLIVFIEGKA